MKSVVLGVKLSIGTALGFAALCGVGYLFSFLPSSLEGYMMPAVWAFVALSILAVYFTRD